MSQNWISLSVWINCYQDIKCLVAGQYLDHRKSFNKIHWEKLCEIILTDQLLKKISIKRGPQGSLLALLLPTVLFLAWSLWQLLKQIPHMRTFLKGSGTEYHWRQECLGPLRNIFPFGNKPFGRGTELFPRLTALWEFLSRIYIL